MWHLCVVSRSIHIRDDVNGGGGTQESAATDNHTVNILDTLTDSDSPTNMSLIHALIARGTTVLAEHATGTAELKPAAQITILSKIPPNNSKLTYVWQDRLIHYVSSNGVIYLVMADDSVGRRMPFAFLAELERRFTAQYESDDIVSAGAHSLEEFEPELARLMHQYTSSPPADPLRQAQSDLNNVKDIMVQNIDSILQRGERLDLLVDKTDTLAGQAYAFRRGARSVRRQQWWKNMRIMALSGVVGLLLLYLFIAQFCGASLSHCRS
ncbi:vesicle-associated membrane protein 7 [Cryptococcus gattii Ru294]|nr:vesicle-associated membrane protein 7 [Cryptococcus gattii Ru294]